MADAVVGAGGALALEEAMLQAADFTRAEPNYGHEVLAALALEGAITLVIMNWDDCVERATGAGTRLHAVITDVDWASVVEPRIFKVHGCATRPPTILATSAQLANPPTWAQIHLGGLLSTKAVAFVGLGDIPEYLKPAVERTVTQTGEQARVSVVSRTIREDWAESEWSSIAPGLPVTNRIQMSAEDFLDALVRGYVREYIAELRAHADPDVAALWDRLVARLGPYDALTFMKWLSGAVYQWPMPERMLGSGEVARALLAVAVLSESGVLELHEAGRFSVNDRDYILLIVRGKSVSTVQREALQRARHARNSRFAGVGTLTVVASGQNGVIPDLPPVELVPAAISGNVIDAASSVLTVVAAERVMEGAA